MDTQKKPCLKCLLRELDEEAYMKQLHRYIVQLDPDVKTAQQVYEKRLELCNGVRLSGSRYLSGMRLLCGAAGCGEKSQLSVSPLGKVDPADG